MAREKWKLTRDDEGEPAVDTYGDRFTPQVSVLAEMARDPDSGLVELAPGVWKAAKEPGRWV